jgi:phage-related protein
MVYHAKSGAKKARTHINNQHIRINDALAAWKEEQEKPTDEQRTLRQFCTDHTIPHTTLWRHINGKSRSRKEYLEDQQKLSAAEERKLVDMIKECADLGTPLNHSDIRQYALRVLNRAKRKGKIDLGVNWVDNFLTRHHQELSTHWSSPLDMARANALTPDRVAKHYEIVKETTEKYNIIPENDYGMDETPIMLGRHAKTRVVGRAGTKQTYVKQDGNRESLTVVETICGDGTTIAPTVIFAGEGFQKAWGADNPLNAQ